MTEEINHRLSGIQSLRNMNKTLKRDKSAIKQLDKSCGKFDRHKYAKTTLHILDLKTAIYCPDDALLNDWLAVHGSSLLPLPSLLLDLASDLSPLVVSSVSPSVGPSDHGRCTY